MGLRRQKHTPASPEFRSSPTTSPSPSRDSSRSSGPQVGLGEFTDEVGPALRESLADLAGRLETLQSETGGDHGWGVRVTESEDGGARFDVTGVDFE